MASIRERNGNYQITVSCGRDIYGHKLRETTTYKPTATTPKKIEKEVAAFAQEFEQKVLNGAAMDGRKITLVDFVDRWLTDYAAQELEPKTIQGYKWELDKRILPALGHLKLSELKPTTINHFFVGLTKDGVRHDGKSGGYSKGSIQKTFNVLSSILRVATEWELIDNNPCEKVRIKASDPADTIKFFTPEQASIFLDFIEHPYYVTVHGHKRVDDTGIPYTVGDYKQKKEVPEQIRVLLNLAIFSGLRKGELLALEFSDVDFENDTITVSKALSVVNGKPIIKSPKTKTGNRVVSIPHFLTARIHRLKIAKIEYRLSVGDYWKSSHNWLFTQDNGTVMNYGTPYHAFQDAISRYNETADKDHQLPHIPFHGLRHTSATLLIASHQDVKTISARLGHAETSTTLNIYAHALRENDQKAADVLENILVKHA